ncbi:MAG: hypothetical protein GY822_24795 [Deltaproteobacteria bacterium]|nr:hypothetical protein [Deltaproteobacteria bacterium]
MSDSIDDLFGGEGGGGGGGGAAVGKLDLKKQSVGGGAPPVQRGREAKLQSLGRQAISSLYMLVRNVKMYDPENNIFNQPFETLREHINTIVALDGIFQINAVGTTVYLNNKQLHLDFQSLGNVRYLTEQFKASDVGGFQVSKPVQMAELKQFVGLFSPNADDDVEEAGQFASIQVGKFAKIAEQIDKMEENAIETERKVDRKKYAVTVYARAIYYMRKFVERLQMGGQLPSMQPAGRIIRDFVDIGGEVRSHFLGMTTTRSLEEYLLFHSVNTAIISLIFGKELGMTREQLHSLGMAALFHDIGMAEIETSILNKRKGLSRDERRVIDLYPLHTVKTLLKGRSIDKQMTSQIISAYESKVDYSKPMKGKDGEVRIMLPKIELGVFGRIIHIATTYDALTSARPFREAYGPEVAMTLMVSDMKYKYDPFLLKVFMKVMAIQPVRVLDSGANAIQIS